MRYTISYECGTWLSFVVYLFFWNSLEAITLSGMFSGGGSGRVDSEEHKWKILWFIGVHVKEKPLNHPTMRDYWWAHSSMAKTEERFPLEGTVLHNAVYFIEVFKWKSK